MRDSVQKRPINEARFCLVAFLPNVLPHDLLVRAMVDRSTRSEEPVVGVQTQQYKGPRSYRSPFLNLVTFKTEDTSVLGTNEIIVSDKTTPRCQQRMLSSFVRNLRLPKLVGQD